MSQRAAFFRQAAFLSALTLTHAGYVAAAESELARVGALIQQITQLYNSGRYDAAIPLAREALAIREKALGPEHPDVADSLNNLAELYTRQGRYVEAAPLHMRSLAIREKALGPEHPKVVNSLNNLASLYRQLGRYGDAEPLYKRSLAIGEKALGPEHPNVADVLNNLAELYRHQGRYGEAGPLYQRSLAIREKALGPEHPDVAASLNNLATLRKDEGRYGDAEPLYRRSLAIKEKVLDSEHPAVANGLNSLAELYKGQGRYGDAEPLHKRSLAMRQKALGSEHPSVAASLNNLAELYRVQGRYSEAAPLHHRSLAIMEAVLGPEHPDVATSLNNLAALYQAQGRSSEGLHFSRRAVAIHGKRFDDTGAERGEGAGAERRGKRDYFLRNVALVYAANEANAAAEGFRSAQLASGSSAAQAVAGMAARFAAGTDALAGLVRERQDLAARWQALDKAIVQAASKPPTARDMAAEAALRQLFAETEAKLDALDARIAQEFPAYAELSHPRPLELEAARALLAPDEAVLVYLIAIHESWLWVLRRDRAAFHRIAIGAKALDGEVAALRNRLDPATNPDLMPFPAARAHALYQKLVGPAVPLLAGARQVFVVADGALESLPFGVMVAEPPKNDPKSPADHRGIAWLARDHAFTVLPSIGSLRALRQFASAPRASAPFAGIGNPVLAGRRERARGVKLATLFRGALADVDAVRSLAPLPETADELRAVAQALGGTEQDLYLAERASEPVLRRAGLDGYRVISFATHGLVSGELKGLAEPALVLTPPNEATPDNDGLLTASKVATLKLNADWVVLSACNTAAPDGTPDGGRLSGLAKAFFYSGARSLLVSHWSVPSDATVKLVTSAFEELKKDPNIGRAEALRRAEMAMLDPNNPPEYAHPLFWAPFVLAGEGGAGR